MKNTTKQQSSATEFPNSDSGETTADAMIYAFPMIVRLRAMRQRVRRLLIINGVALLVLGGAGSMIGLVTLDWAFWFPSFIRFGFALAWLGLLARLISKYIWPPIYLQFSDLHIAAKIEEHFPEFEDRLTSTVSFITEDYSVSEPLQQKLIERTERIAQKIALEDALTSAPVWRLSAVATLPLIAISALILMNPAWLGTGVSRFAFPFMSVQWPKSVHIQPLTQGLTIAVGESVVVSMVAAGRSNVVGGQMESLRGYLYTRRSGESSTRTVMRREARADDSGSVRYAATIDAITQNMEYWFEAGDDSTEDRPAMIRVVDRPSVADLRIFTTPPPYVSRLSERQIPAGQQSVELIIGSSLRVEFKSSKPLGRDTGGRVTAWLRSDGGQMIRARADEARAGALAVAFSPQVSGDYRIHLVDQEGFENQDEQGISVSVQPDAPPQVSILSSVGSLEVTPRATVAIMALARDDLGFSGFELSGVVRPANLSFSHAIDLAGPSVDQSGDSVAHIKYDWLLGDLSLHIGDSVEYQVIARDNRLTESLSFQEGRSHTMRLKVVSETQFTAGVADELHKLSERLRRYLHQQERLIEDTEQVRAALEESPEDSTDADLLRLSAQQRAVADRLASIRRQVRHLADEMALNGIKIGREKQQADLFASELERVIEPTMRQAALNLNEARGRDEPADRLADVSNAEELQRTAARAIRTIINQLTVWSDYNSVVANLRELFDLQQLASRRTAAMQEETVGRQVDDLSEELRAKIQENGRLQDRVTSAIERALAELDILQRKLRASQPNDARALADTQRQLQSDRTTQRSRNAAQAIRQNKTGLAQKEQSKIERTLAEAMARLESKEQRKLAELSKKMARVEDLIRHILEQQQELRSAAGEAQPGELSQVLPQLATRQRNLTRSALDVTETMDAVPQVVEVALRTRQAAQEMTQATDALYAADAHRATGRAAAVEAQDRAIAHLQQAVLLLQELRKKNDQAIERAKLIAINRELIAIRRSQAAVNAATDRIMQRVEQSGRLTRIDVRRAKKQARAQRSITDELANVQQKLDETPVYGWVVKRILESMRKSEGLLADAELERPLKTAQDRAIGFLDNLIEAIKQVEDMAEEQFAGGGGAAGGGQPPGDQQKPVPTIAELIVLKGIQNDLLLRTRKLSDAVGVADPTETQLLEAKSLGQDQRELKLLAQELTRQARGGP